jgi:hypothetical protein
MDTNEEQYLTPMRGKRWLEMQEMQGRQATITVDPEFARISEIVVEERARQGFGLLDSLERSIEQLGVLQPIGLAADMKLIFGGRRLQACKNLGLETIPARMFDLDTDDPVAALRMERDENGQRVDLTPSEKVALGKRIEDTLAGRVGGDHGNQYTGGKVQNFVLCQTQDEDEYPCPTPQGKSSEIAAQAVGMNRETYRQAKAVVDSGNQDVIKAMDSGDMSINAAYGNVKPRASRTFTITLYKNPQDDAEVLMMKGGSEYCTKLGLALLKLAGHDVKEPHEAETVAV